MNIRRWIHTTLLISLIGGGLAGCGPQSTAHDSPILARVGTQTITVDEFSTDLKLGLPRIQEFMSQGGTLEQARSDILNSLIQKNVFINEAVKLGLGADAETAANANAIIADAAKPSQDQPATFQDYEKFATTVGFRTLGDVRTYLAESLTLDQYAQTIQGITPTQVLLRRIVTAPAGEGDEAMAAAQQQSAAIYQRFKSGADFTALAREFATDPAIAAKGGVDEWASIEQITQFSPELGVQVRELPLNTVSEPIQTQGGYFIIEVLERRSFGSWQDVIQSPAGQQMIEKVVAEYRTTNQIEILLDPNTIPMPEAPPPPER